MSKQLYVYEFTYKAYVYAEDEEEADKLQSQIQREELGPTESFVHPVKLGENPLNWNTQCCVYHTGTEDIKLSEVMGKKTP